MEFRTELIADIHDVDHNGIVRTSSLMKYIQSAAQTQLTLNGMSYDELKSMKRAFILSRIKMEFTEPVRAYEKLNAITYPCDSRGYSFLRCYALEKNGRTIGRAVSLWALIDTETRALVRVNDFELGLQTHEPHSLALSRFTMPTSIREVGTYTVNYGDGVTEEVLWGDKPVNVPAFEVDGDGHIEKEATWYDTENNEEVRNSRGRVRDPHLGCYRRRIYHNDRRGSRKDDQGSRSCYGYRRHQVLPLLLCEREERSHHHRDQDDRYILV